MMEIMSWGQFMGWMQYYSKEPFGEERADMRSAIVACVVANANRDPKKHPKPFTPKDFMAFVSRSSSGRYQPMTDRDEFRQLTQTMKAAFGPNPKRDSENQDT